MTRERLAVVAHELRSPVAALAALAERAATIADSGDVLAQFSALAVAAGRDIERLLSDPDPLSIRAVEVDIAEIVRGLARPGVEVTFESVEVVCDPSRVRQAIANLVANGLRHGTRVTIEGRRDRDHAVIRVRDNGPGVDPAIDPFVRGVSTTGSSGYGLWLARAIAEAHGGRLELMSAPGQGAELTLFLPLASAARE